MARPVTLFTGQWADLSLEELAAKCGEWEFDGLELATWGDHFDVAQALSDSSYCADRRATLERHGLNCWAIVSSDARPNLVASTSPIVRSAFARATLITSASARLDVVSPASSVSPAAEQNASSKFSPARKSVVQRPASSRMCWSSSPGGTITRMPSPTSS